MAHAYQGHKIVTLNMNGKTNEKGTPEKRRKLLKTTLQKIDPSLIFCQELPDKFGEVVDKDKYGITKNGKEAGVAWLVEDFQRCDDSPSTSDTKITKIRERLAKESTLDVTDLRSRVAIVKLTTTEKRESDRKTFFAVSWHGPYRTKEKSKVFLGLIRFCKDVCEILGGIPFIIGGDFNFNTSKLNEVLDQEEIDRPRHYPQSQRATEGKGIPYKDNFVFSRGKISLSEVKSFDFERDISGLQRILGETALANVLDHDPVFATLKFPRPAPEEDEDEDEGVRRITKSLSDFWTTDK